MGLSLTVSHWAPSWPPLLCRRRRLSTCAGIGPFRPRLAAIGTSANSSTGSHDYTAQRLARACNLREPTPPSLLRPASCFCASSASLMAWLRWGPQAGHLAANQDGRVTGFPDHLINTV